MTSDPEPTGTENTYREAQRGTEQYLDLIREFLEKDIEHLASAGKFDKAIEGRFTHLVGSGRLDRDIRSALSRAMRRSSSRSFGKLGWVGPFALGVVISTLSFIVALWVGDAFFGGDSSPAESGAAGEQTAEPEAQAADLQGGGEGLPLPTTPEEIIALFDEKYPEEPAWFSRILSGWRADASADLDDEIGRWLSGGAFDTTRVQTGMALWVVAENGWPVILDGVYGPNCSGTNCPTMRSLWGSALDLDSADFVPHLSAGAAWNQPADVLAPFEKFLIVQHVLETPPNG
jgi:hypothetical protein